MHCQKQKNKNKFEIITTKNEPQKTNNVAYQNLCLLCAGAKISTRDMKNKT